MKAGLKWALGIGGAIGGLFLGKAIAEDKPQKKVQLPRKVIQIIGDSQACWCSGLSKDSNPNHDFLKGITGSGQVDCKIGSRIADWNHKLTQVGGAVGIIPGAHVLIFLGSNEMDSTPDPSLIVKTIRAHGGIPVWVGPPLIRGKSGAFIPHVQEILGKMGVPYFDSRAIGLKQDKAGVHPVSQAEANRWLNAVLKTLV